MLAIGDGYRAKNEELGDDGPIFLRSAYLQDAGWTLYEPDRLQRQPVSGFGPKVAQIGDTVLTTKGNSLGRLGLVTDQIAGAVYSPHLSYWRSLRHDDLSPRYLYYWAHSPEAQAQINARAESTDMAPYLSLSDQLTLQISLPSTRVQRSIADLLGTLDDKIELNRRMAETLEAMARALFKSWFVDFDPVHARAEGRSTGLSDDLTSLFPESFGLEGLPSGWSRRPFSDLFDISGGNTPSTDNAALWNGPHQWATPKDLSGLVAPVLLQTGRQLTSLGLAQASSGLLPPGSLLLSTRAPIGYTAFIATPTAINQGLAGIIRKKTSPVYAWAWCRANMRAITANAGGSTFPEISKAALRRLPMVAPSQPVLNAFNTVADSLFARIFVATQEVHTLTALRDTLLPKLISGELRIADTEERTAVA